MKELSQISDKSFAKPNNNQKQHDSKTEVYFSLTEPRKTCSFKANKKLWEAFKSYSKQEYGSVCHILEPIMLAILQSKVYLSNTIRAEQQPIVIENLNVQRVLKRMRRYHKEVVDDVQVEVIGSEDSCAACGLKADFRAFKKVDEKTTFTVYYCRRHFDQKSVDAYKPLSEGSF